MIKPRLTNIGIWLSLIIAVSALSLGFIQVNALTMVFLLLAVASFGVIAVKYRLRWAPPIVLTLISFGAAIGLWLEMWPGWSIIGLLGVIAVIDLWQFNIRIQSAKSIVGDLNSLEMNHLKWLSLILAIGGILFLISMSVQIRIGFSIAILLGILSILGISIGLSIYRRNHI